MTSTLLALTPQPNGVALQPIKLTGARERVAKKTYIRAPNIRSQLRSGAGGVQSRQVPFATTEAGHEVMVDAPQWLVDPTAGPCEGSPAPLRHVGRMSDFAENGLDWTIYEYAS